MLDLTKVKQKLSNITDTSGKNSTIWKPQPGSQIIRFVPYKYDLEFPFKELFFHYGIQGKTLLSLKTFGEPDPISEFAEKLKMSGNRDDFRLGKKFEPKMRTYAPMIIRGEESQGVKFWGFGKMVYQELLSIMSDEDYGDITHPMTGRDVVVDFKSAEEVGRSFPETKVRVKPNQTPLHEDNEVSKKLLDNQKEIYDIFKKEEYDTLQQHLNTYLNGDDTKVENQEEKPKVESHEKVENAFDDLFDE